MIALVNGSLIIKSKHLEEFKEEITDEQQFIMNAFETSFKSKAKNYKYFYRGQYSVMPEPEDIIAGMKERKLKLQKYEQALKKF